MINYQVQFEILDNTGSVISSGVCWSGEIDQIEVGQDQTVRVLTPDDQTSSILGTSSYGVVRREEYPSLDEQIGAIWKVLATLPAKNLPKEAVDMLARIAAVKAQYEKDAEYTINDGTDPEVRGRYMKVN